MNFKTLLFAALILLSAGSVRADVFALQTDCYGGVLLGTLTVTTATSTTTKLVYTVAGATTTDTLTLVSDALDASLQGTAQIHKNLGTAFTSLKNGGQVGLMLLVTQNGVRIFVPVMGGTVDVQPGFAALRNIDPAVWPLAIGPQLTGFTGAQKLAILADINAAGIQANLNKLQRLYGNTFN